MVFKNMLNLTAISASPTATILPTNSQSLNVLAHLQSLILFFTVPTTLSAYWST